MKNRMVDLRNHLFATLEALQDQDNPMDLDRARAVADAAQVVVNSAKVEVDYFRISGAKPASDFIEGQTALPAPGAGAGRPG